MSTALVDLVHAVDRLDWDGVRAAFADKLVLDYTSLFGGEAEELAADELVERWQALLPGFEATQHLLGPVLGTDAGCEAHVRAEHRIGSDVWLVAGHYVAELTDGRISSLTLQTFFQDGVLDLPAKATERVEAGTTR